MKLPDLRDRHSVPRDVARDPPRVFEAEADFILTMDAGLPAIPRALEDRLREAVLEAASKWEHWSLGHRERVAYRMWDDIQDHWKEMEGPDSSTAHGLYVGYTVIGTPSVTITSSAETARELKRDGWIFY